MTLQPICTAPRDGTVIDIWVRGKRVANVRFAYVYKNGLPQPDDFYSGWEHADRPWSGMGGGYPPMVEGRKEATHWAPIEEIEE